MAAQAVQLIRSQNRPRPTIRSLVAAFGRTPSEPPLPPARADRVSAIYRWEPPYGRNRVGFSIPPRIVSGIRAWPISLDSRFDPGIARDRPYDG